PLYISSSAPCHVLPRYSSAFFYAYVPLPHLHSFPTRRSSDLSSFQLRLSRCCSHCCRGISATVPPTNSSFTLRARWLACASSTGDRKSTRLNSSHEWISYAVFCLKKKNITNDIDVSKAYMAQP